MTRSMAAEAHDARDLSLTVTSALSDPPSVWRAVWIDIRDSAMGESLIAAIWDHDRFVNVNDTEQLFTRRLLEELDIPSSLINECSRRGLLEEEA